MSKDGGVSLSGSNDNRYKLNDTGAVVDISAPPLAHPSAGFPVRMADFASLAEALDYAALAGTGMNFYNAKGQCEHELTYAALRWRAREIASRLVGFGLARGERVGIVAEMHPDFVTAFFACQYAGLVAVPLPVVTGIGGKDGYEKQLVGVLESSDARLVLGPAELMETLHRASAGKTSVEAVMTLSALADRTPSKGNPVPLAAHEISHIQFSSGSTRYPLGIEISQRAVMANARSISCDALSFTPRERIASWLPFYHDMGLIGCLLVPLTCQLTIDYLYTDSFARRPAQWLRMISDNRCTISFSPNFGYDICARRMEGKAEAALDLSCWRVAGIGGDMIQPEVMRRFAQTFAPCGFKAEALVPSYGMAEATLAFSFQPAGMGVVADLIDKKAMLEEDRAQPAAPGESSSNVRALASCGRPMPGYEVQIRGEDDVILPERVIGGVLVRGPSLMDGYHNNLRETAACIKEDGWLDTGDMGYMADGYLYITGRRKDMIIINGRNIWPQDIEWHAEQNVPALRARDTAAFAHIDEAGREQAVLLVQCRAPEGPQRDDLKKQVQAAVVRNAGVECRVELIPPRSLPFTTSGKLSRSRAKKAWLRGDYAWPDAQKEHAA